MTNIFIFDQNFEFWSKVLFVDQSLDFWQNVSFWPYFQFLTKNYNTNLNKHFQVPDWPVIPENILKIAEASGPKIEIINKRLETWTPVGEPDRIEIVKVGIELMKRRPRGVKIFHFNMTPFLGGSKFMYKILPHTGGAYLDDSYFLAKMDDTYFFSKSKFFAEMKTGEPASDARFVYHRFPMFQK